MSGVECLEVSPPETNGNRTETLSSLDLGACFAQNEKNNSLVCKKSAEQSSLPPPAILAAVSTSYPISLLHVRYYFDTDRVTQTRFGERRSMLSLAQPGQASGLVITSTMPTADHEVHLVEVRELIDGGRAHTQVRSLATHCSSA